MKILLFTSIVFIILAVNLLISCPTKEGFGLKKKDKKEKKKEKKEEKEEDSYLFKPKNFTDNGNPSQKFLKNFQRQKIEFDGEFSLKSLTPEMPNSEEEAKKMQRERDAKRAEQKKIKKEAKRQSEREVNRREKQARKFCISRIPKTIRWRS